jgi:hypothetical protein
MNGQEFTKVAGVVNDLRQEVCENFRRRFLELYLIAEEKGIMEFHAEDNEEGEIDLMIGFVGFTKHQTYFGDILGFKLEDDKLIITDALIINGGDCYDETGLNITYDVSAHGNFIGAPYIIEYLEKKLL